MDTQVLLEYELTVTLHISHVLSVYLPNVSSVAVVD